MNIYLIAAYQFPKKFAVNFLKNLTWKIPLVIFYLLRHGAMEQ